MDPKTKMNPKKAYDLIEKCILYSKSNQEKFNHSFDKIFNERDFHFCLRLIQEQRNREFEVNLD